MHFVGQTVYRPGYRTPVPDLLAAGDLLEMGADLRRPRAADRRRRNDALLEVMRTSDLFRRRLSPRRIPSSVGVQPGQDMPHQPSQRGGIRDRQDAGPEE
jgi:hypothetical protein